MSVIFARMIRYEYLIKWISFFHLPIKITMNVKHIDNFVSNLSIFFVLYDNRAVKCDREFFVGRQKSFMLLFFLSLFFVKFNSDESCVIFFTMNYFFLYFTKVHGMASTYLARWKIPVCHQRRFLSREKIVIIIVLISFIYTQFTKTQSFLTTIF